MLVLTFLAFHRIQFRVFYTWHTGAAFSSLAVSTLAFFDRAAFSLLAFSVFPTAKVDTFISLWVVGLRRYAC